MITDFENLTRQEMIQYLCLVINNFYNTYDYLTKEEKEYIQNFIKMLDEVYGL